MAVKHEFYLNNERLDVDDSMSFHLTYNSTIFGDLSKLMSHGSTTLKFPMTANNRRIINNINLPDIVTGFPYRMFMVDYYRNSVNIALNAIGYLSDVNEAYVGMNIVWGLKTLLNPFRDNKLRDLPTMNVEWTNDGVMDMFYHGLKDYGFLIMDYGAGVTDPKCQLPSVSVNHILSKIEEETGITLENLPRDKKLYLTTVDRSAEGAIWDLNNLRFFFDLENILTYSSYHYPATLTKDVDQWSEIEDDVIKIKGSGKITMTSYYRCRLATSTPENVISQIRITKNDETSKDINGNIISVGGTKWVEFDVFYEDNDAKEGDYYKISSRFYDPEAEFVTQAYDAVERTVTDFRREYDNMMFPMKGYPINSNLPDITWFNFVNAIALMNGLFPCYDYDKPNTISFFSADDVVNNGEAGNYYDFTGKLVNRNLKHEYRFGDYTQRNKLDYKKDDTVTTDASGIIYVDSDHLDREKTLFELSFSASDMKDGYTYIPAFTKEIDDNGKEKITFKKPSPRLVQAQTNINNVTFGAFKPDMYFGGDDGIIATKYKGYQGVVRTPHVITAEYLLSEVDLINFDIRKPIWDYTLGRMYAIIKLTLQTNNVAKIEMIDVSLIPMG